jgi:hypothetical protein
MLERTSTRWSALLHLGNKRVAPMHLTHHTYAQAHYVVTLDRILVMIKCTSKGHHTHLRSIHTLPTLERIFASSNSRPEATK